MAEPGVKPVIWLEDFPLAVTRVFDLVMHMYMVALLLSTISLPRHHPFITKKYPPDNITPRDWFRRMTGFLRTILQHIIDEAYLGWRENWAQYDNFRPGWGNMFWAISSNLDFLDREYMTTQWKKLRKDIQGIKDDRTCEYLNKSVVHCSLIL